MNDNTSPARRDKGTGSITRTDTGKYRASIELQPDPATGARRRVSATGRTKAEALAKARKKRDEQERDGVYNGRRIPTVSQWCDTWVEDIVRRRSTPKTYETYRYLIDKCIRPSIGAVKLDRLRGQHIRIMEEYVTGGDPEHDVKPRNGTTANAAYRCLRTACKDAVRERVIPDNPIRGLDAPRKANTQIDTLTTEQAARVIREETEPAWHLIWRILFSTGMRLGEVTGITGAELVEQDGIPCIAVEWQLKQWKSVKSEKDLPRGMECRRVGNTLWLTRPKTRAGRRIVPLPADVARELVAYMTVNRGGVGPDELVFLNKADRPIFPQSLRNAWNKALKRAGVPHVRVHSARHTAATAMMRLGIGDAAREAIIGHSSIDITNRIYTHVDAHDLLKATSGIDRMIEGGTNDNNGE